MPDALNALGIFVFIVIALCIIILVVGFAQMEDEVGFRM